MDEIFYHLVRIRAVTLNYIQNNPLKYNTLNFLSYAELTLVNNKLITGYPL